MGNQFNWIARKKIKLDSEYITCCLEFELGKRTKRQTKMEYLTANNKHSTDN